MEKKLTHILNTETTIRTKSLCGLVGDTAYKPIDSNCDACIERFKMLYPKSWEAWERKRDENKG